MSDLENKLEKLLNDKLDTFEVLYECRKLKIEVDYSEDNINHKYLLQKGILIELLKDDLEDEKRVFYENVLTSTQNFLKWRIEKLKGIPCSFAGCLFTGKRHREYLSHLKSVHANQKTYCCRKGLLCKRNFVSIDDLEKHVKNDHYKEGNAVIKDTSVNLNCKCAMISCGQKRFDSVTQLTSHMNITHAQEPRSCVFENCSTFFLAGKVSRHHFRTKHYQMNKTALKNVNKVQAEVTDIVTNHVVGQQFDTYEPPFNLNESCDDIFETDHSEEKVNDERSMSDEEAQHYFMMAYSDFLNCLTSFKFIPLSTVKRIAEEYISIAKQSAIEKEKVLRSSLQTCTNISPADVDKVVRDFSEKEFFLKAQEELLSEHKRSKFIADNFKLVKPMEIILNSEDVKMGHSKDCFHYIPIKESLKALLEDKTYTKVMENSKNYKKKAEYEDLKDGSVFKENKFFCDNPDAVTLLLYSDAVELTNPLGSGRLKHKIVQVFWSVCDIPRHHRSQIDKLQLGLVFREKLLKKYTLSQIFKQLVRDLMDLEESGILIKNPVEKMIKAGVIAYAADNLEAHTIGGFSGSFSSNDVCRFCHCKHRDLEEHIHNFNGKVHEVWTIAEYDNIVQQESLADLYETQMRTTSLNLFDEFEDSEGDSVDEEDTAENSNDDFGLKSQCVFNDLKSFHCVTSMPPDCLHDLFEGVLAQDLLGIIRIFKTKGWFSLEDYNHALTRFPLSPHEASNKPQAVPLKANVKKLSGKAVSIWCHSRFFLSILSLNGWIEDLQDGVFKLADLLVDITNRVTAEKFEDYEIDRLEDLVLEFLDLRMNVLTEYPVLGSAKPKHHFLTHYAENIRKFGPPMGYWTGRFESKHRVAKSVADSCKNFINISKTVSNRQQLRMASIYYHGMFNYEEYELPVLVKQKTELSDSGIEGNLISLLGSRDLVAKQIIWRDRVYEEDMVVVIQRTDLLEMKVGVIKAVVIKNDKVYLVVRQSDVTLKFTKVFATDEVDDSLVLVNIEDLQDTYPLYKRGNDQKYFIIPHHHVSFMYR